VGLTARRAVITKWIKSSINGGSLFSIIRRRLKQRYK
jgi:hypothetical protein